MCRSLSFRAVIYCANGIICARSCTLTHFLSLFALLSSLFALLSPLSSLPYLPKGLHCYTNDAQNMMGSINAMARDYKRPIWVNEFACPPYKNCTSPHQMAFMKAALPLLEASPDVYRYAWFVQRDNRPPPKGDDSLHVINETVLTPLGEYYNTFLPSKPDPAPTPPAPRPQPGPPPPPPPPPPSSNICSNNSTCNVCSACCNDYLPAGAACDACVSKQCNRPPPSPPSPSPPGPHNCSTAGRENLDTTHMKYCYEICNSKCYAKRCQHYYTVKDGINIPCLYTPPAAGGDKGRCTPDAACESGGQTRVSSIPKSGLHGEGSDDGASRLNKGVASGDPTSFDTGGTGEAKDDDNTDAALSLMRAEWSAGLLFRPLQHDL